MQGTQKISVLHSTEIWLSQTMTWLYTQINFLPHHITSHVICKRTENNDQFPIESLISAEDDRWMWRYLCLMSWKIDCWRRSVRLIAHAGNVEAQILHSHFGDVGWANISQAHRAKMKHVVTFYGYDISRLPQAEPIWQDRYKYLFETADLFLCEGPHLRQSLVRLGCPPEKIRVHHLGIDLYRIAFRPRRWGPGEPLRVLIAGTFFEKKGIPYAIEALGRVKDRVDLEITIIGDTNGQERSDREKAHILETVDQQGLGSRTRLLGFVPHAALFAEAFRNHVFLSPSVTAEDGDTEGGAPVAIIELAASGMPVVSSRHCDIPEVLEHGVTGLLAEERDVEGIARNLIWLIDNPDNWEVMASGARDHLEKEFSAIVQGKLLAEHYKSLTDGSSG